MVTYTVLYFLPISILTSKLERLYQIEHPQIVAQFDEVNKMEEDSKGYWVSKPWFKGLEFEAYYF